MKYKAGFVKDDNTAVLTYEGKGGICFFKIPCRTTEEAIKWIHDEVIKSARIEVMLK